MTMNASVLWTWKGSIHRRAYLAWGAGLMAVKYNIDRLVAAAYGIHDWNIGRYWKLSDIELAFTDNAHRRFFLTLAYVALPFIFVGVVLTARRLRDVGWPLWLACLFFVPFVNLVFFAVLSVAPTRSSGPGSSLPPVQSFWWRIADPRLSALLGIVATAVVVIPAVMFDTVFLENYSWGLFFGIPFFMGMSSALVHSAPKRRSMGECCTVALLSVALVGALILVFAIEGLLCLAMAAPLAMGLALLGGLFGYFIQNSRWSARDTGHLFGISWIILPLALYGESLSPPPRPVIAVTTSVVIKASPQTVWRHVVTFSELPPPRDLIFRSGIAYPVRARIWGHGVGAMRHCEFSTGPFVEPISAWDEPHLLAFDVVKQPEPMRELSPYSNLHPAHLDGFFRSRHGEFRLTALSNGNTQLDGTTWYDQNLWPNRYWQIWSDYLVHQIHSRVLEHIRIEAEADR